MIQGARHGWIRWILAAAMVSGILSPCLTGQTTQGLISGLVQDRSSGRPIPGSWVFYCRIAGDGAIYRRGLTQADERGHYVLPSLSPGDYRLRAQLEGAALPVNESECFPAPAADPQFQAQEKHDLTLAVAAWMEVNFELRPAKEVSDPRAANYLTADGLVIRYFGADDRTMKSITVDTAPASQQTGGSTVSYVVDPLSLELLPLTGRDAYTMLMLLPGVTADTTTARGLGFSVNGQRPSSSNYLLDGAENNNLLVTGPLTAAVPEFLQEYRISTSNYSAEYGRTAGFVANAVTRTGGNAWHGDPFVHWESQWLDANGFQENAGGLARAPLREWQPGIVASGPVLHDRLFVAGGFETTRFGSQGDPQGFVLPTTSFVNSLGAATFAGQYLRRYVPESQPDGPADFGTAVISPPVTFNRLSGMLRLDDTFRNATEHLFARLWLDQYDLPDLVFDPYPQFSTGLRQKSASVAAGLVSQITGSAFNEFRASRTGAAERLDTFQAAGVPNLGINTVQAGDQSFSIILPSSSSFYNYRTRGATWEALDNVTRVKGRHVTKAGTGWLRRSPQLQLAILAQLQFASLGDFAQSQPSQLVAETDRLSPTLGPVAPDRSYRYRQLYAFVQDSFHVTSRLMLDYGVRYEYYGPPLNIGPQKDLSIALAPGNGIQSALEGAGYAAAPGGNQPVIQSRGSNWAPRAGLAWDVTGRGATVLRASYGIFYDPLFDNLWENVIQNRYQTSTVEFTKPVALPAPLSSLLGTGTLQSSSDFANGLLFQPGLRAPLIQSAFLGVQQTLAANLTLEVDALASRGRGLITTDIVNRQDSVFPSADNLYGGRLQPALGNLDYRANQGSSDYRALTAALRFRRPWINGQVSYTWSHSIDNQSDSLAGTFLSFNQFAAATQSATYYSSFTRQFASSLDRGNSDFDQRQNLVFFATYRLPGVLSAWTLAGLGALRSGLPFTVYSGAVLNQPYGAEIIDNPRADLVSPHVYLSQPYPGGRVLLNAQAFQPAQPDSAGTSGRNAFFGPGLVNLDASLARSFHVRIWKESFLVTVRADFYNVLNHANLGNPVANMGAPGFGVAQFGRTEAANGFPLLQPLSESARQIQLMLQVHF